MRPSQREQVIGVMDEILESVIGLERPALARVLPVLQQAHGQLEAALLSWLGRQDGNATWTAQRYRAALLQIRGALSRIEAIAPTLVSGLVDAAGAAGPLSVANLEAELKRFNGIFESSVQSVQFNAASIMAKSDRLLIPRFKTSARRYAGQLRDDVVRELAVGRIRAENFFATTKRLEKRFPLLARKSRGNVERLVRTETMHAYNLYHLDGLRAAAAEDPELVMRWDSALDMRRCPLCRSLDGETAPIGGRFPGGHGPPPAHPNCRCCLTPWKEHWGVMTRRGPQSVRPPDLGEQRHAA